MSKLMFLAGLAFVSALCSAGVEHSVTIIQRPDGKFDVTCLDGTVEVKTKDDVLGNRLCTQLSTVAGNWNLVDGGIENGVRMCDLNVQMVRSHDAVFKLKALFNPPCRGIASETQECNGMSCSMKLDAKFYSFDFATAGRLNLTRLEDGFKAGYQGNSGAGGGAGSRLSRVRTMPMDGEADILHATNDDGVTWLAICDDGFGASEAAVACREMGFSSVRQLTTSVMTNSNDFGLDDVACKGTESSLFDCEHLDWRVHNCGNGEHIQLTCNP